MSALSQFAEKEEWSSRRRNYRPNGRIDL